jgi:prolyl oligopeptidase
MRRIALLLLCASSLALFAADLHYPKTDKRPVVDKYGDVSVTDDYRWLENLADPEVKSWIAAQNALTREILDAVPAREAIGKKLMALNTAPRLSYSNVKFRGGRLFAMKYEPPKEQSQLVVFDVPSDPKSERVVFDPNADDATTSVDWYVPSLDGKRVATSLSRGGSEDGSAYVYDVETGIPVGEIVPRVNYGTALGSIAWAADGKGFWYTRYPQGNERAAEDLNFYQQVYFHVIGTPPSADTYVVGKDFPRIAEIGLTTSDDGRFLLAEVLNGDGGEAMHLVRGTDGAWTQLTRFADKIHQSTFGGDGALYLLSHAGAPNGKILRVDPANPKLSTAEVVVPEGKMAIDNFVVTKNVLYVAMMNGGPSELVMFDRAGKSLGSVPVPPISAVYEGARLGGDDLLVRTASYTTPPHWSRYDAASKALTPTALRSVYPANYDDVEVVREFATSKDGTKVPMNIIYRKGLKRDGTNPTLLTGYGGYSISQRPGVSLSMRLWLDSGGMFVVANVRGGAEYGEAWHEAGKLLKKQNVFDDFIACAQHLIARKYTTPAKLAIEGGSNGGLLVGAALTQHPELFRVVVASVPVLDMPRFLRTPNGVFNTTEYGSPDLPEQLRTMLAYSPYHHVTDGKRYPAVIFMTGDNDARVDPFNSRKMVARLQAANASAYPILLRTTSKSGHGSGGLSEAVAARTDSFTFLWRELGMKAP